MFSIFSIFENSYIAYTSLSFEMTKICHFITSANSYYNFFFKIGITTLVSRDNLSKTMHDYDIFQYFAWLLLLLF